MSCAARHDGGHELRQHRLLLLGQGACGSGDGLHGLCVLELSARADDRGFHGFVFGLDVRRDVEREVLGVGAGKSLLLEPRADRLLGDGGGHRVGDLLQHLGVVFQRQVFGQSHALILDLLGRGGKHRIHDLARAGDEIGGIGGQLTQAAGQGGSPAVDLIRAEVKVGGAVLELLGAVVELLGAVV